LLRSFTEDTAEERVAQGDLALVDQTEAEPVRRVAVPDAGVRVGEAQRASVARCAKGGIGAAPNGMSEVGLR
jgi:hypothetical protein